MPPEILCNWSSSHCYSKLLFPASSQHQQYNIYLSYPIVKTDSQLCTQLVILNFAWHPCKWEYTCWHQDEIIPHQAEISSHKPESIKQISCLQGEPCILFSQQHRASPKYGSINDTILCNSLQKAFYSIYLQRILNVHCINLDVTCQQATETISFWNRRNERIYNQNGRSVFGNSFLQKDC